MTEDTRQGTIKEEKKGDKMKNLDRSLIDSGPYDVRPFSRSELIHANNLKREYMRRVGFKGRGTPRLLQSENTKLKKGWYKTVGLSLLPADLSGVNVCSFSTAGCRSACLASSGRGKFNSVINGRRWRTNLLDEHPDIFIRLIAHELRALVKKYGSKKLAVRLNVLSDLRWERIAPDLFREFRDITFYDYSKYPASGRKNLPDNYYLTGSYSERNTSVKKLLDTYPTVAVVFDKSLPDTYQGVRVVDGDASDDRFNDPTGVIVGLKAKGDAIGDDSSGFVVTA